MKVTLQRRLGQRNMNDTGIRSPALAIADLPLCDCIHAPPWVQVTYLSMGALYILLCEWLGLDRRS